MITYQGKTQFDKSEVVNEIEAMFNKHINNDDESKEVTIEYYFQYVLNEKNEIDDLFFIKKYDTYTINGERIRE